jgi:2-keto-4-pentenoate hydratase/2-oxohepta-3-ene-1,7-dioic acid hydratase in catechol pathway
MLRRMKLATFTHGGRTRIGVVAGDEIVDLSDVPGLPREMRAFLDAGTPALDAARAAAAKATARLPLASVALEAPIRRPPEILAVGLNYRDHIEEAKLPMPQFPLFFNKQTASVAGPHDAIHLPRVSNKLDYEGELAFVIGRLARHVPRARAHEVIAGYLVCDDVSVRDWQFKAPTWTLGKSFDTHCPLGPWIVTPDEVEDPHALELRTWVNGEERQHSNTRNLIFDCYHCVETLSTVFTLEPGLVVTTGTPSGVGGPQRRYLKAGDVVRIEIERIGAIENRVVPEPDETATP